MKKYITIAALLATGTAFANAAGTAFTLDSSLVVDGEMTDSAYTLILGKSKADAASATGLSMDQLGYQNCQADIYLKQMFSNVTLSEGEEYALTSITFLGRPDTMTGYTPTTSSLSFMLDGATYTSGNGEIDSKDGTIGTITFSFAKAVTLDADTDHILLKLTASSNLGFSVAKDKGNVVINGANDFTNGWNPIVRLSGTVIPEPSAFGLLAGLGALALVGTRRRRK